MTTFQPGDTLGRYRIERPLGHGAMGEVYLARDPQIDRPLAVKTLRLVGIREEEVGERKERLLREARTAGRLIHPHIVTLFDAGEQDGVLFLAFEYVAGSDLARRLQSGPLPVGEALRIAREACEGLGCAHRAGIVHRDVKPSNLMLDADGRVKIADFGIAKMQGQGTELTISGAVMGSPHYLSPEQVRGEELDGRSDLFSLGIVVYEMLSGRRPFAGETISTLVYQILGTQPPPLPALRPGLEPHLPALLGRLLAKDRTERVSDAQAAIAEIERLERELPAELLGSTAMPVAAPTDATVVMDSGSLAAAGGAGEGEGEGRAAPTPAARGEAVWPVEASAPVAAPGSGAAGTVPPPPGGVAGSGAGAGAGTGAGAGVSAGADGSAKGSGGVAAGVPGAGGEGTAGAGPAAVVTGAPAGDAAFTPPPPPPPPVSSATAPPTAPPTAPQGPQASSPPTVQAAPAGSQSGGTYAVPSLGGKRRGVWLLAVAAVVLVAAAVAGFLLLRALRPETPVDATVAESGDGLLGADGSPIAEGADGEGMPADGAQAEAAPGSNGGEPATRGDATAPAPSPRTGGDGGVDRSGAVDGGRPPARAAEAGKPPAATPQRPVTGAEAGTAIRGDGDGGGAQKPVRSPSSPPVPAPSAGAAGDLVRGAGDAAPARSEPPPANTSRERDMPAADAELSTGMVLVFEIFPPDAFVLVDGTVIGRAHEYGPGRRGGSYSLPSPGTHRVTLRRDGMEDYNLRIDASGSRGESVVRARMKPLAAAETPFSELEMHRVREAIAFRVDPPTAKVMVDDKLVGTAREYSGGRLGRGGWLELPLGMHRVSFMALGHKRVDIAVDVTSGATENRKRIDVVLPRLSGGGGR